MEQYLTHYWPISNSSMIDVIGNVQVTGTNIKYVSDRFGSANSALNLSRNAVFVSSGVYFDSPEFTISLWIFPISISYHSRLINFASLSNSNANLIAFSLDSSANISYLLNQPNLNIFNNMNVSIGLSKSRNGLLMNKWQFLTATFSQTSIVFYINANLTGSAKVNYTNPRIIRTSNQIGSNSRFYLDDLRFYNKSLTQSEIFDLMCENQTSKFDLTNKTRLFSKIV
jgi:hypothetical protein